MLGDPARRAAYDRALAREQPAAGGHGAAGRRHGPGAPLVRVPGPPLRAGPVRVEGPRPAPSAAGWDERGHQAGRAGELALRYLARDRDRPW